MLSVNSKVIMTYANCWTGALGFQINAGISSEKYAACSRTRTRGMVGGESETGAHPGFTV